MKQFAGLSIALGITLVLLVLLAACSAPAFVWRALTPTTAPPTETALAAAPPPIHLMGVSMHLKDDASTAPEVETGTQITVVLDFRPSQVTVQRDAGGRVLATIWQPWEDHPAVEMRACFSLSGPCQPDGDWQSYAPSLEYQTPVDWLGPHEIHAAVEFRDHAGRPIPTGDPSAAQPEERYPVSLTVISRQTADVPIETLSPAIQTAQAATRTAFPVTGAVEIEEGRCCMGGQANTEIDLHVRFEAHSPAGSVTEMRVQTGGGCQRDTPALDAPWEPFSPTKIYRTTLALNWVGFYLNVQYRDSAGGLSPVYCDDISLEGAP